MVDRSWPDTKIKYLKNYQYQDKSITKELQELSTQKLNEFQLSQQQQQDGKKKGIKVQLIVQHYQPSLLSSTIKVKSLKMFPNHPAYPYFGLFACKSIAKDSLIVKYLGLVCYESDYDKSSDYVLAFATKFSIDAKTSGNEARYVNDYRNVSPQPNVEFREFYDTNHKLLAMGIFALRDIKSNEELTINYGKAFWKARNLL